MRGFSIDSLKLGPMENFIYLIHDHDSQRTAVVDPAWEPQRIVERARELGVTITDILLTHSHHDHINGIEAVLDQYDAPIHLLKEEARFWGADIGRPVLHHGGDTLMLGSTPIRILHTPGHTPGSACFHVGDRLIAGDTLFVYGCGRCDLRGGDPNQMFDTLRKLRADLPPDTVILPGHDYAVSPVSSLAEQEQGNPFMLIDDRQDFIEYRMHLHDRCRHEPYGPEDRDALIRMIHSGRCN